MDQRLKAMHATRTEPQWPDSASMKKTNRKKTLDENAMDIVTHRQHFTSPFLEHFVVVDESKAFDDDFEDVPEPSKAPAVVKNQVGRFFNQDTDHSSPPFDKLSSPTFESELNSIKKTNGLQLMKSKPAFDDIASKYAKSKAAAEKAVKSSLRARHSYNGDRFAQRQIGNDSNSPAHYQQRAATLMSSFAQTNAGFGWPEFPFSSFFRPAQDEQTEQEKPKEEKATSIEDSIVKAANDAEEKIVEEEQVEKDEKNQKERIEQVVSKKSSKIVQSKNDKKWSGDLKMVKADKYAADHKAFKTKVDKKAKFEAHAAKVARKKLQEEQQEGLLPKSVSAKSAISTNDLTKTLKKIAVNKIAHSNVDEFEGQNLKRTNLKKLSPVRDAEGFVERTMYIDDDVFEDEEDLLTDAQLVGNEFLYPEDKISTSVSLKKHLKPQAKKSQSKRESKSTDKIPKKQREDDVVKFPQVYDADEEIADDRLKFFESELNSIKAILSDANEDIDDIESESFDSAPKSMARSRIQKAQSELDVLAEHVLHPKMDILADLAEDASHPKIDIQNKIDTKPTRAAVSNIKSDKTTVSTTSGKNREKVGDTKHQLKHDLKNKDYYHRSHDVKKDDDHRERAPVPAPPTATRASTLTRTVPAPQTTNRASRTVTRSRPVVDSTGKEDLLKTAGISAGPARPASTSADVPTKSSFKKRQRSKFEKPIDPALAKEIFTSEYKYKVDNLGVALKRKNPIAKSMHKISKALDHSERAERASKREERKARQQLKNAMRGGAVRRAHRRA